MTDAPRPARIRPASAVTAVAVLVGMIGWAAVTGPASIPPGDAVGSLVDRLPGVSSGAGLTERQADILWLVRFPRIVLAVLVGGILSLAGAAYQGVFRNPLADPYLLGVAAGAGLGATLAIVAGGGANRSLLPVWAFCGAVGAVGLTYLLGRTVGDRTSVTLILAGVAVSAFLTSIQTFVQQRNADTLREVYDWILGRMATSGWTEVRTVAPYVLASAAVLLVSRRLLDVLAVGDPEAAALGIDVGRVRVVVVAAATLGTAAAVSVTGLIGFVGIVVPHTVRLLVGSSYRVLMPLSALAGAAFLVGADVVARTVLSPAELPIGVVTSFLGAPFFVMVLRSSRGAL